MKFILLHVVFILVALTIAFVLVPFDQFYFDKAPVEEIKQYYQDALNFKSNKAWKIVFTWFLGLSCGRLIVRALNNNKYTTKPEIIRMDDDSKKS